MNAVISLCHFCEIHGPSVLMSTQAFHETDAPRSGQSSPASFYGNTETLSTESISSTCEACHSLRPAKRGFLSNDHEARVSYLSTRQPMQAELAALLRQACVRSLSCEISPSKKEGAVYFGDDARGHVLSITFSLRDSEARGFLRWYSMAVLMRDKLFLLHSWPFLTAQLNRTVAKLQADAQKVFSVDCVAQRARRLATQHCAGTERSLAALTGDEGVLRSLHSAFTWLLRAGAGRMVETLPFHPTTSAVSGHGAELRRLCQHVGVPVLTALVYGVTTGLQVVVRGQPTSVVETIVRSLQSITPLTQTLLCADTYSPECRLLGVATSVAVPRSSDRSVRLDVLATHEDGDGDYRLAWEGVVPDKCPTYVARVMRCLENVALKDRVLDYQLEALREEWINIARVASAVEDSARLLRTLGLQEQDKAVINYWATLH